MKPDNASSPGYPVARVLPGLALVAVLLLVAGCGTPEPRQPPHPALLTDFEEAAQGSEEVAGTYRLTRLNTKSVPAAAAVVRRCRVYLTDGTINLVADGRYRLSLVAERICDGEAREREEIVTEGLYAAVGFSLRFGDKMLLASDELAPEITTGPEEVIEMIFPGGRFAAIGTVRVDGLTATLDNLRSFVFVREEADPALAPADEREPAIIG